jgi:hypothetical protein
MLKNIPQNKACAYPVTVFYKKIVKNAQTVRQHTILVYINSIWLKTLSIT